ncbi:hypothetical protein GCWU000342_01010 [Shuttleworthella satelles DSM 14600]|uniref:Uncharacterized protein n=1 Tax=Shuttleworthella satelles DSM 14600 TaxID=626523 RepID=C4GAQ8_9FIRM|nr:hypothetical protein GCWU000342_01010 [Shuttleworthia satelles DSM 14600]
MHNRVIFCVIHVVKIWFSAFKFDRQESFTNSVNTEDFGKC